MSRGDDENPPTGEGAGRQNKGADYTSRRYEVGRNKPPVHTRWKKGQSGNPRGRPRKPENEPFAAKPNPVRDIILEELARPVAVKSGAEAVEMETIRAIARAVVVGAIKGGRSQQRLALQYATAAQDSRRDEIDARIRSILEYQRRWGEHFDYARRYGLPEPSQLPHPDHVDIDPLTLEVVFTGPTGRADKKAWDHLKFQLRETERLLRVAQRHTFSGRGDKHHQTRVRLHQEHLLRLEKQVPKGWNWRETLGWEVDYTKRVFKELDLPWPPEEEL